jgi:hypothetical protein
MNKIVVSIAKNTLVALGLIAGVFIYICVGIMAFALTGGRK